LARNTPYASRFGFEKAVFACAYVYSGIACAFGSFVCIILFVLPLPVQIRERETRRIIHYLCGGLVAYLRFFKILEADFGSLARLRQRRGVIIAVNHPTYIDAILMMSQLPNVFCLTKAGLNRNPFIAAMVKSAGYEDNADSNQLLENCSRRLQRGENLLVFPEGTRTIGKLKRGFTLMAARAQAPVITVLITSLNGAYLRKGQPFFALPPSFPIRYRFAASQEFLSTPEEQSREFCVKIESHFREALHSLD
jgi:1-acyl-sn-glycerol-3-phosphate acyltransferase